MTGQRIIVPTARPFVCFEKTTASEADRRVRNYLALDYETSVEGEQMRITADALGGDCYFILRLRPGDRGDDRRIL